MDENILFQTINVSKSFGPVRALNNVDFSLQRGEIRGLIGENGSGKSTLAMIIAGIVLKDSGKMLKEGKEYNPKQIQDAFKNKITIVTQESGLIEDLSIANNLLLGREKDFTVNGFIKAKAINEAANLMIYRILKNKKFNVEEKILNYSFEDKKLIEIIKALYQNPEILILDETADAFSRDNKNLLWDVIRKVKNEGVSIIYISHTISEVVEVTDTITIMRDGEIIDNIDSNNRTEDDLKKMMVGRELKSNYYREDNQATFNKEKVVLKVENLSSKDAFHDISFSLHEGEILCLGGLSGCGMSQLGKAIFGLLKTDTGTIYLPEKNKYLKNHSPVESINQGIAYLPRDRDSEGVMLLASVKDNITLVSLDRIKRKSSFISPKDEVTFAEKGVKELSIKTANINQFCIGLSGGNRQKVSLVKWLMRECEILILDCPTRGVDVGIKAYIYQKLHQLKLQKKSIILISEELTELIGMGDRILIMKEGNLCQKIFIRDEGPREEEIINYMI